MTRGSSESNDMGCVDVTRYLLSLAVRAEVARLTHLPLPRSANNKKQNPLHG